jgi:hypothetical protein
MWDFWKSTGGDVYTIIPVGQLYIEHLVDFILPSSHCFHVYKAM